MATPPVIQVAVYISGHGYGHYIRMLNLLELLKPTDRYNFHIRTSAPLYAQPITHLLQPTVVQSNPYQLDVERSLHHLQSFDPTIAQTAETRFLEDNEVQAVISDAPSLPCLLAHTLNIPAILITNFTFDSVFQTLLDASPTSTDRPALKMLINEMTQQYALAHTILRLPGFVPFPFKGPRIIDVPMHSRRAKRNREDTLRALDLQELIGKKILLHTFGGHVVDAPSSTPKLPKDWVCLSQTLHLPAPFYRIPSDIYLTDVVALCDALMGKLGWGTCSEVIGNGYKPFIYVPRSAFIEEVGLLQWMESKHRKIVRLEVEKYESEEWVEAIEEAERLGVVKNDDFVEEDQTKNDEELVKIFGEVIDEALK